MQIFWCADLKKKILSWLKPRLCSREMLLISIYYWNYRSSISILYYWTVQISISLNIKEFPRYFSYQCENQWTPPQNIFLASKQLDTSTDSYNLPNSRTDLVDTYIDPMEKYNISESASNNFVGGGNSGVGTCGLSSSIKSFSVLSSAFALESLS